MTQEALLGRPDFPTNGHSPQREWEAFPQIFPQSKKEAKDYLKGVPSAVKLIDLWRIGIDLASAGHDIFELVRQKEFWEKREIFGKKPLVVYSGGFGTNEPIAEVPMRFLRNKGSNVVFYRYRSEKYPNRKQAPLYLPWGANVEPLQFQLDDYVDFCLETSDKYDQELALIGESKGGLLVKLALMWSKELRERTKIAITGGSPAPIIENVNTAVLGRYIHWLDHYGPDDFALTPLLSPFNAQRLEDFGLMSVENKDDRVIGRGIKAGVVYETTSAHSSIVRNPGFLSFASGVIDKAFGVMGREGKRVAEPPQPVPWGFPYNPLLA